MSLPQYQVNVLDPNTGEVRIVLDATAFYELKYSRALNDIGAIALTLPSTDIIRDAFVLDAFIEVYRADLDGDLVFEETYLVRLVHRYVEGNEERFVVGGMSLNHLLSRRIIDPDDDPLIAGGFSTKSGDAGQVLFEYCNEQIGPGASVGRSIPSLTVGSPAIPGDQIGARLRHENLFKIMQDLSKQGRIDFNIRRTAGNNLVLDLGIIGSDKTKTTNYPNGLPWVGLSPRRGNLSYPSLINDRKEEGNFIYALGQGQRERRIVYKAAGGGVNDSPFNRHEFTEDIRNIEKSDVLGLITGAEVALRERVLHTEFTYQPSNLEPGNTYRFDWDLGDAISVDWDENVFDLRIINVEITISSAGEVIKTTVTDDFEFPVVPPPVVLPDLETVELGTRWTMWHQDSIVTVGAALVTPIDNLSRYNILVYQSPAAINNAFTNGFFCKAGTYTLSIHGLTANVYGISTWYVDGVLQGTTDWYSAALTYSVVKTVTITVLTDGWHELKGVAASKNASSGDYFIILQKMWIKQATD